MCWLLHSSNATNCRKSIVIKGPILPSPKQYKNSRLKIYPCVFGSYVLFYVQYTIITVNTQIIIIIVIIITNISPSLSYNLPYCHSCYLCHHHQYNPHHHHQSSPSQFHHHHHQQHHHHCHLIPVPFRVVKKRHTLPRGA